MMISAQHPCLGGSDRALPQNDQREAPPAPPTSVLHRLMADDDEKPDSERSMAQLLKEFLEHDTKDRRAGRTREHSERMLQRVIDEQQKLRIDMVKGFGSADTQFASHRIRLEGVESGIAKTNDRIDSGLAKVHQRIDKLEDGVDGVKEISRPP